MPRIARDDTCCADLDTQLSAAEKVLCRYSSRQDLYLPLQAPMDRQHISQIEIREKADTISIEQLLAV